MTKKFKKITVLGAIACLAFFAGCGAGATSSTPSGGDAPTDKGNAYDPYLGDWQLSGNISDFYFLDTSGSNTLSAEFADVSATAVAGDLLTVVAPIVIDGVGNVLDVSFSVKVKGGAEIVVQEGVFFAMDGRGYEITYGVKTLDGNTHSFVKTVEVTGADDLYVTDDMIIELSAISSVVDTRLINLNGALEYTLTDLLSDDAKAIYDQNAANGKISWRLIPNFGEAVTTDKTKISFGDEDGKAAKASYIVVAQTETDGVATPFYVEPVDFFDLSADGFVWNSMADKTSSVTLYNATTNPSVEVVDGAKGMSGSYYKIVSGLEKYAEPYNFMLHPMHSTAYYEMFADNNYTLAFDFYVEGDGELYQRTTGNLITNPVLGIVGTINGSVNGGAPHYGRKQYYGDRWNTVSLTLNDYGEKWSLMANFEDEYFATGAACYIEKSIMYVGNFRLIEGRTTAGDLQLVDVKGKTTYDLSAAVSEEGKAIIDRLKAENKPMGLTLTPGYSALNTSDTKPIVLDSLTVDLTKLEAKYYTFKVAELIGNFSRTVYMGEVDFYDSSKPFEWNDELVSEVSVKAAANGTSAVTRTTVSAVSGAPQGKTGDFLKVVSGKTGAASLVEATEGYTFTLLPKHSKAYYELFRGQNVKLAFDAYIEIAADANGNANGFTSYASDANNGTVLGTPVTFKVETNDQNVAFWGINGTVEGRSQSTYRTQVNTNKWQTVTLRLEEDMLDKWNWNNLGFGFTDLASRDRMLTMETIFGYTKGKLTNRDGSAFATPVTFIAPELTTLYVGNFRQA